MNSWANVGDIVFVLSRDNEPIPCKVIYEIGIGMDTQLFFEPIHECNVNKIPKNKLKAFLYQVGYNGGYVFKERQNALDYLDEIKTKGKFNVGSVIGKKTNRKLANQNNKTQSINISKIKEEATSNAIEQVRSVVIASMLIALNTQLKIGPKRGAELVKEINRLIEETDKETLIKTAEEKMKIKIK